MTSAAQPGRRTGLLALATGAAILSLGGALVPVQASDAPRSGTASAGTQSLSEVLRNYGQLSRQQIIFTPDAVSGITVPADQAPQNLPALQKLLRQVGLDTEQSSSGVIMVTRSSAPRFFKTAMGASAPAAAASASSGSGASVAPAAASDALLDEVIVTARRRAENIQDVPMSVTAVGEAFISKAGLSDLSELSVYVPSFNINTQNTSRNTAVLVRGIGSAGANPGIEPSVGLFIDGVYQPQGGLVVGELADVKSVEVLRGPQGALYGRNTPVGAVNVTTQRPTSDFSASLRGGIGDYELRHVNGYVNGGLTDNLAGRVSFWMRDRNGYERNPTLQHNTNNYDGYGVRLAARYSTSDAYSVNVIANYAKILQKCCMAEQINPSGPYGIATAGFLAAQNAIGYPFTNFADHDHVVWGVDEGNDTSEIMGASVTVDWKAGNHNLTSITAFNRWNDYAYISNAALPQRVYTSPQSNVDNTFSEDLRISSETGRMFEYVGGVYLYAQNLRFFQTDFIGAGANRVFPAGACAGVSPCVFTPGDSGTSDFAQTTNSYSLYGELTLHPVDKLTLTASARHSADRKNATIYHLNVATNSRAYNSANPVNALGEVTREESKPTWAFIARYAFTNDVMAYFNAATGFKAGGYSARRVAPGTPIEFKAETSTNYEVGVKASFFDRRLTVNADVFNMKLNGFQDSTLNPVTGNGFIVGNAGDRKVRGIEADIYAQPNSSFAFTANVAYLDATYTSYASAQCAVNLTPNGASPGTCNYSGRTPAFSPRLKASGSMQLTRPLGAGNLSWFGRVEYNYTSEMNLAATLDLDTLQQAYGLFNLRAGLQGSKWEVAAWMKNAGDTSYYIAAGPQPLAGFVSSGGTGAGRGFVGWYGAPRTVGLEAVHRF